MGFTEKRHKFMIPGGFPIQIPYNVFIFMKKNPP